MADDSDQFKYSEFMKFMQNVGDGEVGLENGAVGGTTEDWVKDFNTSKKTEGACNGFLRSQKDARKTINLNFCFS